MKSNYFLFLSAVFIILISGVLLPETVGFLRLDYNSASHYISELGANDAQYAKVINLFGFLPVAVSSAVAIFYLRARLLGSMLPRLGLILLCVGLSGGYLSAFLFPCDYGCPLEGSVQQMIHNLAALITYPFGILGLIVLAAGLYQADAKRLAAIVSCVAVLSAISFVMMIAPEQADLRGFWQRLSDYAMFMLIMYLGTVLSKGGHRS